MIGYTLSRDENGKYFIKHGDGPEREINAAQWHAIVYYLEHEFDFGEPEPS